MLYVMLFSRYPFDLNPDNRPKVGLLPPQDILLISIRVHLQLEDTACLQYDREVERMQRGAYELPGHPQISGLCQDMLKQLITADPDERLTSEQCLSHPWFQQVMNACSRAVPLTLISCLAAWPDLSKTSLLKLGDAGSACDCNRGSPRASEADGAALVVGEAARIREEDAAPR